MGLIANLFGQTSSRPQTSRRTQLQLENLEDRLVPAYMSGSGDVVIDLRNTTGTNNVSVNYQYLYGNDGSTFSYVAVNENGHTFWFQRQDVEYGGDIVFYGGSGNDNFTNNTAIRSEAYGFSGNDILYGGYANDVLDGGYGNDTIYGRAGSDTMYAGADTYSNVNVMDGGDDGDVMYGNFGTDYMYGGGANDYMYGGYGNDYLAGQGGLDHLYGQDGNDMLTGGDDGYADYLNGGAGNDSFQIEYYFANGGYYNRDYPADFAYGDSFYDDRSSYSPIYANTGTMTRA